MTKKRRRPIHLHVMVSEAEQALIQERMAEAGIRNMGAYAVLGCVVGCAIGLPLSKSLYDFLIAGHFPSAVWQFPIISLGVILLFVSIAAIAAVYAPAKRIRNMSITATINEL